jgi:uncharacterized protein
MEGLALFRLKDAIVIGMVIVLLDLYIFRSLKSLLKNRKELTVKIFNSLHWFVTLVAVLAVLWHRVFDPLNFYSDLRQWITGWIIVVYGSKLVAAAFLLLDDSRRTIFWIKSRLRKTSPSVDPEGIKIPRSEFLNKTAVVASAVPLTALTFGILSGAHDYRIIKRTIKLPNLPKAIDGIRIGQLSDIHAGTLFGKTAVQGGVDMLMDEKPDVIFFTGDLVNYYSREIKDYFAIFSSLRAPLGVFSVTGNHDYGDYNWWPTKEAKENEFKLMAEAHTLMGYDLLLNENRLIKIDSEQLAIIGVENWSLRRNQKYGKLDLATNGTEDVPVKLLLSHDPSHWDAVVRKDHPEIDIMFSGHTHGYQCGIEVGDFRWSPAQYRFDQWADLYKEGNQYLYINRGFGSLGYPGRIGMPPELTIIELKRG